MLTGKEAKLAWANGEIVQIRNVIVDEDFYDLNGDNAKLGVFDLDFYEFRIKPKTITINGMEVVFPRSAIGMGSTSLEIEFSNEEERSRFLNALRNISF